MSFTFDFKKLIVNAQISDRGSLEYFAMHSRFHSCGLTHHRAGSVTRIAFKYKLMGFRINFNFSKMISLFIILCLFIHNSKSKHSRKATAQASLMANNCFQF